MKPIIIVKQYKIRRITWKLYTRPVKKSFYEYNFLTWSFAGSQQHTESSGWPPDHSTRSDASLQPPTFYRPVYLSIYQSLFLSVCFIKYFVDVEKNGIKIVLLWYAWTASHLILLHVATTVRFIKPYRNSVYKCTGSQ